MRKTLAALTVGLALVTAAVPKAKADSFAIGLSSPCHGLLAVRGVYDFNDKFGIQADLGIGFTSIDFRIKRKVNDSVNFYGYAGAIGISPWMYLLPQEPEGAQFGIDLGAGVELGRKKGLSIGIEGGLIIPIPPEPDTQAFRVDLNLMYRFPPKK